MMQDSFMIFWNAYPNKFGKAPAAKIWERLSQEQRTAAVAAIPAYMASEKPSKGFVRQGDTYLSKRTWEDSFGTPAAANPANEDDKFRRIYASGYLATKRFSNNCRKFWKNVEDLMAWILGSAPDLLNPQTA